MQIGIITPIKLLKYCTTKTQYVIPSLFYENKAYKDFYLAKRKEKCYIILDIRKVSWRRAPETNLDMVKNTIKELNPNAIILPSFMFEAKRTMEYIKNYKVKSSGKLFGCLEGTNLDEVLKLKEYYEEIGVTSFAIPSHIYNACTEVLSKSTLIYLENHRRVEELDGCKGILVTSLPVRLGLQGRLLSDFLPSPPNLTFNEEENKFPKIVERNIKELISILGDNK